MDKKCAKCGGAMERGYTTADGLVGTMNAPAEAPRLLLVIPGEPIAANPITAFRQGLAGASAGNTYHIWAFRCQSCSFVEFYAE